MRYHRSQELKHYVTRCAVASA